MTAPVTVSVDLAAEMIGCSRSKLYKVIAAGEIKARKMHRRTLIEVAELHRYIASLPHL